jgi:DNA-binding transcriptional LysR family regulator
MDIGNADIRSGGTMTERSRQSFMTRVGLKHFRLAVAIGERGSILQAASDLGMAQPTATKLLQDLEAELGAPLFVRSNRGVQPNAFGAAFIQHGKLMLAQMNHAAQQMDDLATGAAGRVAVGTVLAASAHLLPAAIARLSAVRPDVLIHVVEGANGYLMPLLAVGDLDLVVGRLSEFRHRDGIEQIPLYDESVCLVVRQAHPLAGRRALGLADLVDLAWVLPPPETTLRRQLDRAFHDAGLEAPRPQLESISLLTNRWLLRHTDMVAAWPRPVLDAELAESGLVALPLQIASMSGPVGVSRRRDALLSPAAEALIAQLQEIAAETARPPGG